MGRRIQPHRRRPPSRPPLPLPPALNRPVEQPSRWPLALPLRIPHAPHAHDQVPLIASRDVPRLQTFSDHPSDVPFKGHGDAPQPAEAEPEERGEQPGAPCNQRLEP